jgi:hypothetical protein
MRQLRTAGRVGPWRTRRAGGPAAVLGLVKCQDTGFGPGREGFKRAGGDDAFALDPRRDPAALAAQLGQRHGRKVRPISASGPD